MVPNPPPAGRLAVALAASPEPGAALPSQGLREDGVRALLGVAADYKIPMVATRPDGDVERTLGQAWPFPSPFKVSVRTVSVADGPDRVEARARRSLERMGLPRGDVLLVSNAADLCGAEGRALWERMLSLKDRGLFRRIGFLARMEDGPGLIARRFQPDVVQIPCNLLDQRAARDGVLDDLASQDVEIHLSSVFAQGLLFASRESLPAHLSHCGVALSRARRRLAEARLDPMQAALAFALGRQEVSTVVVGVASAAELRAVIAAAHAPTADIDWSLMALEEPAALTAGPSRISTAA